MTQIEQIRAEIKRLEGIDYPCDTHEEATGFYNALDRINDFLGTLQEQEPEVDLEKEIDEFWSHLSEEGTTFDMIEETARHFYELGQASMPMPEDTVLFQKGVAEGKRLMMEDAVDARVVGVYPFKDIQYAVIYPIGILPHKDGEKVKVIIVKEDEQ